MEMANRGREVGVGSSFISEADLYEEDEEDEDE